MAFDRAATLRHAEKLLRQGKLDAAIAAYASVIEHQPSDWNTANALGDVYLRAGQPDRATELFTRSADRLIVEGFAAKAAAIYKKILKLRPDDERALLQAGELSARQGLFADARAHLTALADRREARGDFSGATDVRIRLDSLDPNDFERRLSAARLRTHRGDTAGAVRDFKDIARDLEKKRRSAEAIAALEQAAQLVPDDGDVRSQLVGTAVAAGDFARARASATTVEELKSLADALEAHGRHDEATETLRLVARLNPADVELARRLARAFIERGDVAALADVLTPELAHADPPLLLAAANLFFRGGMIDEGLVSVRRYLEGEVEGREQVALLSCELAEQAPDAGFRALELATDAAAQRSDWPWAAAALQEFTRRAPAYVPGLLRLVETCVDGGLDTALYDAQVRLADAYLTAGAGAEARTLAEDLVDREPWQPGHVDRLRRALALLGDPDPDGTIAARLSVAASPGDEADTTAPPEDEELPLIVVDPAESVSLEANDTQFELSSKAIDLDGILGEVDLGEIGNIPQLPVNRPDRGHVDLSVALSDMAPIKAQDLDGVFEQLRDEVAKRSATQVAEADLQRALALHRAGDLDACIPLLQSASREPSVRFAAASLLGRIFSQRNLAAEAIEWFEQAAAAPAPTASAAHDVLYDLADTLEAAGEPARALAVWLELQADAGVHRDVAARIDRLTKVKARG